MKLAVFDFDSTLMDGETIDFLARELGIEEQVAKITEKTMQGELDFYESLKERVALLKGMSEAKVNDICANLPYMPGAKETIAALKEKGYRVVCFSGGFWNATRPAKEALGFDADFSNVLHAKDGILTGEIAGEMMFGYSKGEMMRRIQDLLGVSIEDTIATGDGANDASMYPYAAKKVAFCAKPILKKQSNIQIDTKDLRELLKYI